MDMLLRPHIGGRELIVNVLVRYVHAHGAVHKHCDVKSFLPPNSASVRARWAATALGAFAVHDVIDVAVRPAARFEQMALRKVRSNLDRLFDKSLTDLIRGIRNNKENE
ncbi:hypothetical protein ANCDUO_09328, partial [Ancylostoma duodenale]